VCTGLPKLLANLVNRAGCSHVARLARKGARSVGPAPARRPKKADPDLHSVNVKLSFANFRLLSRPQHPPSHPTGWSQPPGQLPRCCSGFAHDPRRLISDSVVRGSCEVQISEVELYIFAGEEPAAFSFGRGAAFYFERRAFFFREALRVPLPLPLPRA
jgi:hypothetical protein